MFVTFKFIVYYSKGSKGTLYFHKRLGSCPIFRAAGGLKPCAVAQVLSCIMDAEILQFKATVLTFAIAWISGDALGDAATSEIDKHTL